MSTKIYATIIAGVFLLELSTARTIRHHETIIKPNGDKIVHSWTHEVDDTELNSNKNFLSNIFEDGKDRADEHIFMTRNFGSSKLDKPGLPGAKNIFEVPQIKIVTGIERGQFEKAWGLESDIMTSKHMKPEPELEPSEEEHNWKSSMQKNPSNFNSVTHTNSLKPTQLIKTDIYSGPQTIFTGNGDSFGGWTGLNTILKNLKQHSWLDNARKPYPGGDDKAFQKPGNNNNPVDKGMSNFPLNIFEEGEDGADEQIVITRNVGLPKLDKPGPPGAKNIFQVPQIKLLTGMERGHFEKAWDLEPDIITSKHIKPEPSEAGHNWKSSMPQNPLNFNSATHTNSLKPTQYIYTHTYSGPQTIFTGNGDAFGGWTDGWKNRKQYSWQNDARKLYSDGEQGTVQKPGNNYNPVDDIMAQGSDTGKLPSYLPLPPSPPSPRTSPPSTTHSPSTVTSAKHQANSHQSNIAVFEDEVGT